MDDFLTQLYQEEQEKVASADVQEFMNTLSVDELVTFLGLEKVAGIPGPDEAVMPSGQKGSTVVDHSKVRKERGDEAQAEADKALDESKEKEGCGVKQASAEWADQVGRFLAHEMAKEAGITPKNPSVYEADERLARIKRLAKSQQKEDYRRSSAVRGTRQGIAGGLLGAVPGVGLATLSALSRGAPSKKSLLGAALLTGGGAALGTARGIAKARAARRVSGREDDQFGRMLSDTARKK